jgi:hypothetical protein
VAERKQESEVNDQLGCVADAPVRGEFAEARPAFQRQYQRKHFSFSFVVGQTFVVLM